MEVVSGGGQNPLENTAGQGLDLWQNGFKRVSVIWVSRQGFGMNRELAALAAIERGGDGCLQPATARSDPAWNETCRAGQCIQVPSASYIPSKSLFGAVNHTKTANENCKETAAKLYFPCNNQYFENRFYFVRSTGWEYFTSNKFIRMGKMAVELRPGADVFWKMTR